MVGLNKPSSSTFRTSKFVHRTFATRTRWRIGFVRISEFSAMLAVIFFLAAYLCVPSAALGAPPNGDIYILAGQSNMAGAGFSRDLTNWQQHAVQNAYIWLADPCGILPDTGNMWHVVRAGLGASSEQIGPELQFARTLKARREAAGNYAPFFIVKLAVPGTFLAKMKPKVHPWEADWNHESRGELFDSLVYHVLTAMGDVSSWGYTPHLRAIVWMQGESDALSEATAGVYYRNLSWFLATLSQNLVTNDFIFVGGLIHNKGKADGTSFWPYANTVRESLKQMGRNGSNQYVETNDLPLLWDQAHYNSAALIELGRRFAEKVPVY